MSSPDPSCPAEDFEAVPGRVGRNEWATTRVRTLYLGCALGDAGRRVFESGQCCFVTYPTGNERNITDLNFVGLFVEARNRRILSVTAIYSIERFYLVKERTMTEQSKTLCSGSSKSMQASKNDFTA